MVTDPYRDWALDQLRRASPATITHRAMFGGVGVYGDGAFFALMDDDRLYFKVDDATRPAFEERGMGPFLPFGDPDRPMRYYEVPPDLLEDPDALGDWVDAAIAVARAAR
jgi:DNA transformation protein